MRISKTRLLTTCIFGGACCESAKYGEIISVSIATVPSIRGTISSLETVNWMPDLKPKINWTSLCMNLNLLI